MLQKTDRAFHTMVKKLKKGSGRKLFKSGTPKKLWDDCLELESYRRSNIAHIIYKPDGKVPEIIIFRETFTIRQFCEFEWFE